MGSRYLTDLADVLRGAGLLVQEVDGWQGRSRSSGGFDGDRPWCIMWHHTASNTTPTNDINYICYGSPDAPLANLYLEQAGIVWVCAAGGTNTNGKGQAMPMSKGTVPADSMNTHAIGIEAANDGLGEPWPQVQIDAYFAVNNALAAAYGLQTGDCSTHHAYAQDRKIDPATAAAVQGPWQPASVTTSGTWSLDDIRQEAAFRAAPAPQPPTPTPEDQMLYYNVAGANAKFIGNSALVRWTGPGSAKVDKAIQTQLDAGNLVLFELTGGPNAFSAAFLDGPLPTGDRYNWTGDEFANSEQIKAGES